MALNSRGLGRILREVKEVFDCYVAPSAILLTQRSVGFNTSAVTFIKEIQDSREGNARIIEGITHPSPREPYLLTTNNENGSCIVCKTGLVINHTDVLILSQFVRPDGCMLPRRVTGLCKKQQKKIATLVATAQKAGLMSILTPANSKKDSSRRFKWKKFNSYYDESNIKS